MENNFEFEDKLVIEGINSMGYGIMPKAVAKDKRLTIEAKAIYAYFVSYAGAGNSVFPKLKTILEDLNIGENRFYRHRKLLIDCGYISVEAFRNEKKVIYKNVYTLHTNPKELSDNDSCIDNDGVSPKMKDRVSPKMKDRGIPQNEGHKLTVTTKNNNNRTVTTKTFDDDEKNINNNQLEDLRKLIQSSDELRYLAQELFYAEIDEIEILKILVYFSTAIDLLNPDVIEQQLRWMKIKSESDTGISSFADYFINGYKKRLDNASVDPSTDIARNLKNKLGLEDEISPVIPMHNWLEN